MFRTVCPLTRLELGPFHNLPLMGLFRGLGGLEGLLHGQTSTRFEAQGLGGLNFLSSICESTILCNKIQQRPDTEPHGVPEPLVDMFR